MNQFLALLGVWHDFYVLTGTGSVTLVGLMFVAVTFGSGLIDEKNVTTTRAFVDPVVLHFVQVFLISCLALVPSIDVSLFGILLAAIGGFSLITLVRVHRGLSVAQSQYNDLEIEDWLSGFGIPLGVYLGFLACGVAFLWGYIPLGWLAGLTIVILLNSLYCAWELIMWLVVVRTPGALRKQQNKKGK